jgi:Family of unknown function (DUF6236)
VQEPGLYFPFIHVRDDDWLKGAALYWPWIGRLSPQGYRKHDTHTAQEFVEAGVLRDQDPGGLVDTLKWDLLEALRHNRRRLQANFSLQRAYTDWDGSRWGSPENPAHAEQLGWIHFSKIPPDTVDYLARHDLATRGRARDRNTRSAEWIGLHPALAGAYMTALAGQIGVREDLQPVTDQTDLRRATLNTEVESALNLLVGSDFARPRPQEALNDYLVLAFQCVLPKNLAAVPAARILECRTALAGELQTFRDHLQTQQSKLREEAALPDARRRMQALSEHVEQSIEIPLRELEKGLRLHKLEPVRTIMVASATVVATNVEEHSMHAPSVQVATTTLAAIVGAWWHIGRLRSAAKKASPVGYLLDIRDRLTPKTLRDRIQKVYTGV